VRPLSIAPMMDHTDRYMRVFLRQLTRHTLLYTEMVHANAVIHGDRDRLLGHSPEEHPLAIQLGGDDPVALAEAARIAADWGYDEVNLNVGCPSERVQTGRFGACLMAVPDEVARMVEAMRAAVELPVTVKHRIGIDDRDSYQDMVRFVRTVAAAGCDRFTVHARKAWLTGLSPRENRTIPPLRYPEVFQLKREFPELAIEINGGVRSLAAVRELLDQVDAVMIGRAAVDDPYLLAAADSEIFGQPGPIRTRHQVAEATIPWLESMVAQGVPFHCIARHMINLFAGRRGAAIWRRTLGGQPRPDDPVRLVREALARIPE